jgi:hypothetical protein
MELRAVPAQRLLAPLAVLVPILAMLVGTAWAITTFPPLAILTISGGLAATAAAGRHTYGARISLIAGACALPAAVISFYLWWGISVDESLCGKDVTGGWTALAYVAGALVFFALGSFGFQTGRAAWIVPLAVVAAALAMSAVFVVAPGAPGFCET